MTPEQKAAYVNSQTVCALVEAMGMMSENLANLKANGEIVHDKEAFMELQSKYGIYFNAIHEYTHL